MTAYNRSLSDKSISGTRKPGISEESFLPVVSWTSNLETSPSPMRYTTILTLLCFLAFLLIPQPVNAMTGEVIITGGADEAFRDRISGILTRIINLLEDGNIALLQDSFTAEGYNESCDLLECVEMSNASPVHESCLLKLPRGGWEVRDIRVKVSMGDTEGNPYQYLVFTLNPEGMIAGVRFAMELTHYRHIVEEGERLKDFAFRQQILQFIEVFRTAYNRKDLDYLKKIYSDDALIIVGRVIKARPDLPDMLEQSYLGQDKIEFIRTSKANYIRNLARVFQCNAFVKVVFDSIGVLQHDSINKIYGVTLRQEWHSSTYSDLGWVFLMIDFRDEEQPIIHVRSWQPEKFPDGSVLGLYDFKLIP